MALVHAALFFEHAGLGRALDNALSLVARGGTLSVVLQLPEREQQNVTTTSYPSMQTLVGSFSLFDVSRVRALLEKQGFGLLNEELRPATKKKDALAWPILQRRPWVLSNAAGSIWREPDVLLDRSLTTFRA